MKGADEERYQLKKSLDASKDKIQLFEAKVEAADAKVSKSDRQLKHCTESIKTKDGKIDTIKCVIKTNKSNHETMNAEQNNRRRNQSLKPKAFTIWKI